MATTSSDKPESFEMEANGKEHSEVAMGTDRNISVPAGEAPENVPEKDMTEPEENVFEEEGVTYDDSGWVEGPPEKTTGTEESPSGNQTCIGFGVMAVQRAAGIVWTFCNKYTKGHFMAVVLVLGYIAFFITAMVHERLEGEGSIRLLVCTIIFILVKLRFYWIKAIKTTLGRLPGKEDKRMRIFRTVLKWVMYLGMLGIVVWLLTEQGIKDIRNLQPVPGIFVMMLVCLLFSTAPSHVNWHTVYWSLGLQFVCAVFVLRLQFGQDSMTWLQDRFNEFFANTAAGSIFLFGRNYQDHYIIFGAFPIIFFSNATLCLLYYLGAMQIVINAIGSVLQFVMGTTPIESMAVAAGIFLEGVMTLLSVRPYLGRMTKSQLFLVLTSVLSSLGGSFIGILIQLGVKVSDIIPAMLMSAPATFTVCKLIMPEVTKGRTVKVDAAGSEEKKTSNNILEVVQTGAIQVLALIGNMSAVVYVFYSFISWINHTLVWFGDRVGVDDFTLQLVFSYVLYPLALCMGVELDDCQRVATLLGFRVTGGNLIAFQELTKLNANRDVFNNFMNQTNNLGNYTRYRDDIIIGDVVLENGFLSARSERMVTYSLCGFSSIVSVGLHIGVVATLIPRRQTWIAQTFFMALVAGNVANCLTGAFAGLFYYN